LEKLPFAEVDSTRRSLRHRRSYDLKSKPPFPPKTVLYFGIRVKSFNVKQHLQRKPIYYAEPTADRIWYKAKE
jgi:hypothetical protein